MRQNSAQISASPLVQMARLLPPETAHRALVRVLRHLPLPATRLPQQPCLGTTLFGRTLGHPIGVAAGFDKNAEAVAGLFALGAAGVEIGTVTPRAQPGNPRPRVFRLIEDRAVINRLGFNNAGADAIARRLAALPAHPDRLLGVNIGMNKDAPEPVADYLAGLRALHRAADYLTVNVSSPNTQGLRALQSKAALRDLLRALIEARTTAAATTPLVVKIAPDLTARDEADIAEVALDLALDGLIVSNTTLARPDSLRGRRASEAGGLSGAPLFTPATAQLRRLYRLTGGRLTLIGVGGVFTGADAYAKLKAGASFVQLYTGMVYRGPRAPALIARELGELLQRDGTSVAEVIGVEAATANVA